MYDVYITKYKSGNSIINSWTKIFGVPANDDNGFPVLSPSVKCSEDNAASFDFSMDMNSPYYDAFMHLKTLVCVEYDGDYIFFGRVLTIDNSTVYQTKRVHCEGAFGFMNDTHYEGVVEKDKQKIGWSTYYDRIINNHNAMIQTRSPEKGILRGTVTIDGTTTFVPTTEERKYEPSNWTQTGSLISSLISEFGGHMIVNYRNGGNYLDWYKYYARDLGVNRPTVSIGENIIDISTSANNVDKIFTWVTPMGDSGKDGKPVYLEGYTYTDKNGTSHTINSKHIPVSIVRDVYTDEQLNDEFHSASEYSAAQDNYGDIYKTQTFASATTQEQLWNYTIKWIKECYFGIASSFTVRAYDMHVLDSSRPKILIGDCVNVQYVIMENGLRTVKTKKLVCKSVTYDLFNPDNNSYTFGIPSEILNRTYSEGRGKSGSEQVSGGGGGGGNNKDEGNYSYTFEDAYNWIRASNSGAYGGRTNADRFKANGEMSGTVKYYDPEDLPTGETISQHPEIIRTGTIIGRISSTIFVAHDPGKGLFAFNTSTYTYGAVPARHWYTKHSSKVVSSYTPPSALLTDEEKEIIEVASNWGIELKTKDDVADFSNTLLVGLGNNIKGLKTQIWDPVSQKVVEPFKAVIGGLGEIGESIFGFLGLSGENSKVRVSDDGTEDDTAGAELDSETLTLGTFLENWLHPKVQLDGGNSQVKAGFDSQGNWKSVMNASITWTDEHGQQHTTDGFVKAMDFSVPEVASFKTKFIAVDQLVANKATIADLNAQKARIDSLESDSITVRNMHSKNVTFNTINGSRINCNEVNAQSHLILPNGVYLEAQGVWQVQLVNNNDGTYTLKEIKLNGDERSIGTFNRAGGSILHWNWSTGTYTVLNENDEVLLSTTLQAVSPVPDSTIQKTGKVVYRPYQVMYGADEEHLFSTGKISTISMDASAVFNDGWDRALQDCEFPDLGTDATINVKLPNADTVEGTPRIREYTLSVDDDYAYLKRTDGGMSATAARVENPAYQRGKDAIKLALSWNDQNDTGTVSKVTSGSTKNSVSFVVSASADIEYNSSTHKYTAKSQGKIDGTARGEEGSITGGTEAWDAGVTSGKNAVGLTINSRDAKVQLNKSSNAITEAQILLNLGTLTKASGSRTVSVSVGGVSNFLAQPLTDYKTGWDDAVGKRSIPGAGNGENFTAKWPNSTLSTGQDTKTYSLGNDSDNTVKVTDGTNTVAKFSHNKYNGGWNAARGKNVIPGAGNGESFTAKWPGATVGTGQDSKTYSLGNDSDNTVKVTDGTNTVAKFSHNKYNGGWNAARGKNVIPGAGTAASFTAKWPGATVGTGQDSKTYSISNDGDNAVKITDGTNTVAKMTHNKYTTGYNAGFDASHFAWLVSGSTGDVDTPGPGKYRVIWQKKDGTNVYTSKCWEFPDCWLDIVEYDSTAEVLGYDTTLALVRTWSNGTRQVVKKWNTPPQGSTSHSVSVSSSSRYHGYSVADVMDRMGLSSQPTTFTISSSTPCWGFYASCGGHSKAFIVQRG